MQSNPKYALKSFLQTRMPNQNYPQNTNTMQMMQKQHQNRLVRHQLRQSFQNNPRLSMGDSSVMYNNMRMNPSASKYQQFVF